MPIATSTSTATTTAARPQVLYEAPHGTLRLRGHHEAPGTQAFPELDTQGYTVVKNVISAEKAKEYEDRMYQWLESHGKGFKKDDKETWKPQNLPNFDRGGLFHRNGVGQEQFAWDIRSEPGLIDAFAKIWGTEELLVSVDSVNISLPFKQEDMGGRDAPWPHVDQSPNRRFKHCVQGIMNLAENGPNDGGLMVLENSLPLFNAFFESHEDDAPPEGWSMKDSYPFSEKQLEWFYERGCTWKKVEAGPGDVILWDSRCIHYGAAAKGDRARVATYVCYKPAAAITPSHAELRKEVMRNHYMTSHDPIMFHVTGSKMKEPVDENETIAPKNLPILSKRALQLAGVEAY